MVEKGTYTTQKKYLSTQKQLRVWFNPEELDAFKGAVERESTTIYAVVHEFVAAYIETHK